MSSLAKSGGPDDTGSQVAMAIYNALPKREKELVVNLFLGALGVVLVSRALDALIKSSN